MRSAPGIAAWDRYCALADQQYQFLGVVMNRLEQDAADTLHAYEQRQAWADKVRADLARSQQKATGKAWAPALNEQQKQEQDEYIKQHKCPF